MGTFLGDQDLPVLSPTERKERLSWWRCR